MSNTLTRLGYRTILLGRKYSPQLLAVAGTAGVVTTVIMASKATLKLEDVLDEIQDDLAEARDPESKTGTTGVYIKGAIKVAKLYAPAALLGATSVTCFLGAQGILNTRNAALAATLQASEASFAAYREKVAQAMGAEEETELRRATIEEAETESGLVAHAGTVHHRSQYARVFDEFNVNWTRDAVLNANWLRCQQEQFQQRLQTKGHVFLNEVYDALGFPHTPAGQIVGWVYDGDGDNYIDFFIYEPTTVEGRQFINARTPFIELDFNVDGVVWDRI